MKLVFFIAAMLAGSICFAQENDSIPPLGSSERSPEVVQSEVEQSEADRSSKPEQEKEAQSVQEMQPEQETQEVKEAQEIPVRTQFQLIDNPAIGQKIRDLLKNNVTVLTRPAEKINPAELRLLRFSVRREIIGLLATEGYFSPVIKFEIETKGSAKNQTKSQAESVTVKIQVDLGAPAKITSVEIDFVDDTVPPALQKEIQASWLLKKNLQFREDDWTRAKAKLIETLNDHSYAAAKINRSEAIVDEQQATLSITVDSGPSFHIGELHIQGLRLYKPWLLDRYHPPAQGDLYNRAALLKFQRDLQNSPYFTAVTVSVDPNPAVASALPINVVVKEHEQYDVGSAAGYSTNTGMRGELSFRDRNFYGDAYDFRSVIRIEQLQQVGYADIYLPPKPGGYLDSVGVLFNRSDIAGLVSQTSSFGAKRVITENAIEKRLGLSFVYELSTVDGGEQTKAKALVASIGRTWRRVNNAFDPRQGYIAQLDLSGAVKVLVSDQNFLHLYGKYQRWIPVGRRDVLILRGEGGYVASVSREGIPEDFLFRAGGSASVRGYSYQSLGVNQAYGVVGGRVLTTASAEYVHWLDETWGVAGFVDIGDAADTFTQLNLNQGIGLGVRYKTPAGPIALDVAYGRQARKYRLDFSIGIAF